MEMGRAGRARRTIPNIRVVIHRPYERERERERERESGRKGGRKGGRKRERERERGERERVKIELLKHVS